MRDDTPVTARLAIVAAPDVDMTRLSNFIVWGPLLLWRRLSIFADAAAVDGQSAPAVESHAAAVTCPARWRILLSGTLLFPYQTSYPTAVF